MSFDVEKNLQRGLKNDENNGKRLTRWIGHGQSLIESTKELSYHCFRPFEHAQKSVQKKSKDFFIHQLSTCSWGLSEFFSPRPTI